MRSVGLYAKQARITTTSPAAPAAAPPGSRPGPFGPLLHHFGCRVDRRGHVPMPEDVSLPHHGMRLLDAPPACRRHVLEVLRQPLKGKSQAYNLTCVMDLTALAAWVTQIIGPTFQPSGRVQTVLSRAAFAGLASRHVMPHLPLDKSDHRGQRCSDPATVDSSLP
jgi:Magnesium chelatase, subunit ChlI